MPATSLKLTPRSSWAQSLPRLRPKAIAEPVPPIRRNMKKNTPMITTITTTIGNRLFQAVGASWAATLNPFFVARFANLLLSFSNPNRGVRKAASGSVAFFSASGLRTCRVTVPVISCGPNFRFFRSE